MVKRSLSLISALFLTVILIGNVIAITGSMGNSRMILRPTVNGWTDTVIDKTILVKNTNEEAIKIELEVDSDGKSFIELIDTEFELEPGEERKAKFQIKVKKEGTYNGKINVYFSPIEGNSAGVALTSRISVVATKDNKYAEGDEELENESNGSVSISAGSTRTNDPKKKTDFISNFTIILVGAFALLLLIYKKRSTKFKQDKKE